MKNRINYPDQLNCAHAWANQLSDEGSAGNLFFEGNTIFSYGRHFPIAILDGDRVFFSNKYYSRSTAKQKCRVRSAVSHNQIINVPFLPNHFHEVNDYFVTQNVDIWIDALEKGFAQFNSQTSKAKIVKTIQEIRSESEIFLRALSLKPPKRLQKALSSPVISSIDDYIQNTKLKARKRQSNKTELFLKRLDAWRIRSVHSLSSGNPEDSNLAYLRYDQNTGIIETSKGIKVPGLVAEKFYRYINEALTGINVEINYQILNFNVSVISRDYIVVGCHKIPMAEVKSIADALNW